MSRSRKQPYITQGYGSKNRRIMKSYFNRKLRRKKYLKLQGKIHKKYNCSWDICDYKFYSPEQIEAFRK